MSLIKFSLVTTCKNETSSVERWKNDILQQTRQPSEIVIVDAFSDDGTYDFLLEWSMHDKRIKLIQQKSSVAAGRNLAIKNSTFEFILSTDMGVRLNDIWCEELIRPFELDENVDVVAGNTCIDKDSLKSKIAWAEYYFENGGFAHLVEGHVPGNRSIAYKKSIWEELGGLPEDLSFAGDDSVFGRQLVQGNYKFAYAPKAMTYWGRPETIKQFFREHYVYGKGDGEALIKVPRAFKWYRKGRISKRLVPYISALIGLSKMNVWKGFFRALKKGDLVTSLLIPYLSLGRAFNYSKGYIIGYDFGSINCLEVRGRIKRNNDNIPLL